jgi:hypothetical protein
VKPIPNNPDPAPGLLVEHPEMMLAERTFPLPSHAGGNCREWIQYLHKDAGEPLSETGDQMRRIFRIYQMENRTDRLVNRLVGIEKALQVELSRERAKADELAEENKFIKRMLSDRDREYSALQSEFRSMKHDWVWRTMRMIRCELGRLRRFFRPVPTGSSVSQVSG